VQKYNSGRFVELKMPLRPKMRPKMRPKISFGGHITNSSCIFAQNAAALVHKTRPKWCTKLGQIGAQMRPHWCTKLGRSGAQNSAELVHKYGRVGAQNVAMLVHETQPWWCTKLVNDTGTQTHAGNTHG
jgi:hypothetical protein